jgi:putative ABC transport system permease protein
MGTMSDTVQTISILHLLIGFVPAAAVIAVLYRWNVGAGEATFAVGRMLIQLMLVGYVLTYVFEADGPGIVFAVLAVMLAAASWIALRPLTRRDPRALARVGIALTLGGGSTLALITQGVVELDPWFWPRYLVPLAGMTFANSMNTVSLAAERFEAETASGGAYTESRNVALRAAMIPTINSLLAVGLVSLPGMMTGQILSGVSPLIAARYQIMVMCMVFGASGLTTVIYLWLLDGPLEFLTAQSSTR